MSAPVAVVVGVGAERGLGGTVCRRFAREGFHVLVAGRTGGKIAHVVETIAAAGGSAEAVVTEATREEDVVRLFERAGEATEVVVFNAATLNVPVAFRELTAERFDEVFRSSCFAGFLVGREAARLLVPLERGTVIFTGASASLRGRPGFAQFAAAKSALRMIAQSMAREFGPAGVHVAHVIVDGGIAGDRLEKAAPALAAARGEDGLLDLEAIAESYVQLHRQHRTAWSHEIDLRPYKEPF